MVKLWDVYPIGEKRSSMRTSPSRSLAVRMSSLLFAVPSIGMRREKDRRRRYQAVVSIGVLVCRRCAVSEQSDPAKDGSG